MTGKTGSEGTKKPARTDRVKAALKANMARRKAQSRARQTQQPQSPDPKEQK